jgi:hypothetical protein
MKFRAFVLFVTAAAAALTVMSAQTTTAQKKAAPPGAATKKAAAKKAAPKQSTAANRKGAATRRTPARRAPVVPRQSAPTPERYREIQGALAAKGYLKAEPSGVWDAPSIDALKRYQAEHKEDPSGRITAASLIGLGLGPQTPPSRASDVKPAEIAPPPAAEPVTPR